ncbi:MAG TPA: hypothetical protein DCS93_22160 [Microscillaceae bacterium]|nr:hypothetical protein [Microscillaceae bacterium]
MANVDHPNKQGVFEVVSSFAIKRRGEFYFLGQIKEGKLEVDWYLNITLNSSLALTIKVDTIEDIEITGEKSSYKLIISKEDPEMLDLLLGMSIENEYVDVTINGED